MVLRDTQKTSLCFQCAKCSAGCPVADEMDLLPHQIVHAAAMGMTDEALSSKAIWMCAGCFTCAVRCPNEINITALMDELRQLALDKGISGAQPAALTFHRTFLRDLGRRGRIHEMRMMGEFNIGIGKPLNNALLAPKMIVKGRLPLLAPRAIKGFKRWMRRLWKPAK